MGSQCLGCFIDDVLKETQRQLAASEEARKKAEANCELYAAEMSEAKAAGWYSAQELFDAYKKLVAELAKLREQKPVVTREMVEAYLAANQKYWEDVDKLPSSPEKKWRQGTPHEATKVSLIAALSVAAPVPPADVAELNEEITALRMGWAECGEQKKELELKLAEQSKRIIPCKSCNCLTDC